MNLYFVMCMIKPPCCEPRELLTCVTAPLVVCYCDPVSDPLSIPFVSFFSPFCYVCSVVFRFFDIDGDGFVDHGEFLAMLAEVGPTLDLIFMRGMSSRGSVSGSFLSLTVSACVSAQVPVAVPL